MSSLAGRVSAAAGAFFNTHYSTRTAIAVNRKWISRQFSALSLSKPTLPTPILTWILESEMSFRSSSLELRTESVQGAFQSLPTCLWRIGLPDGDLDAPAQFCNSLQCFCFRRR